MEIVYGSDNGLITEFVSEKFLGATKLEINGNLQEILLQINSSNLFTETKTYLVFNSEFLSKDKLTKDEENQIKELDFSSNLIVWVVNAKKLSENSILKESIIIKSKVNYVASITEANFSKHVKNYLKRSKIEIEDKAIKSLKEMVIFEWDVIKNELDKLILLKEKIITEENVKNAISTYNDDNVFDWINAFIKKDLQKTYSLYKELKLKGMDEIGLLTILANHLVFIRIAKNIYEKNNSTRYVANELKLPEFRILYYLEQMLNSGINILDKLIDNIFQLDLQIKMGIIDKDIAFKLFIIGRWNYENYEEWCYQRD